MALCIKERTPGFENMQERPDNNPPKDLADHKGSNVSNGTQPEEERMQGIRLYKQLSNSKLNCKGIMISKSRDSEANTLIKDG